MQPLRAHVRDGRYVIDEPASLPEGTEVLLVPVDGDDLNEDERLALYESIRAGIADVQAGRVVDAREAIARLRARA